MSLPVRTVIQMDDEYIRLDTTIIAIDNLINEAATGSIARALFNAKDVIYSQQRYSADVQPVKRGRWIITDDVEHFIAICSECGRTEDSRGIKDMPYCHCGARMDGEQND
jgi:hypothetical protein